MIYKRVQLAYNIDIEDDMHPGNYFIGIGRTRNISYIQYCDIQYQTCNNYPTRLSALVEDLEEFNGEFLSIVPYWHCIRPFIPSAQLVFRSSVLTFPATCSETTFHSQMTEAWTHRRTTCAPTNVMSMSDRGETSSYRSHTRCGTCNGLLGSSGMSSATNRVANSSAPFSPNFFEVKSNGHSKRSQLMREMAMSTMRWFEMTKDRRSILGIGQPGAVWLVQGILTRLLRSRREQDAQLRTHSRSCEL